MALALARFRPSTVISTVAPRATPSGATELMVGGVVRLPVGESVESARSASGNDGKRAECVSYQTSV